MVCAVLRKFYTAQEYEIPQMSAAPRKTSSSTNMQCSLLGAKQVVVALLINMLQRSGIISIVEWLEIWGVIHNQLK